MNKYEKLILWADNTERLMKKYGTKSEKLSAAVELVREGQSCMDEAEKIITSIYDKEVLTAYENPTKSK